MRASVPETAEIQHFGRSTFPCAAAWHEFAPADGRTRYFRQPNRADAHVFTGRYGHARGTVLNASAKKASPTRTRRREPPDRESEPVRFGAISAPYAGRRRQSIARGGGAMDACTWVAATWRSRERVPATVAFIAWLYGRAEMELGENGAGCQREIDHEVGKVPRGCQMGCNLY